MKYSFYFFEKNGKSNEVFENDLNSTLEKLKHILMLETMLIVLGNKVKNNNLKILFM